MGKLIDAKSAPSIGSELAIFDVPPTQVAYEDARWITVPTTTPVNDSGPYIFSVSDSRYFLNTGKCYVSFRLRLTSVPEKDIGKVAVCNYIGGAFFSQVKVELNNVLIFDCPHYGYKAYLEALLNSTSDQKKSIMQAAGYYEDDLGIDAAGNTGHKARLELLKDGLIDVCAPLHIDQFNVDRYLLPHVNLQISLYRNSDPFVLVSHEAAPPQVATKILSMRLHMRAVDVVSSAGLSLERSLLSQPAKYPYRRTRVKMLSIPGGRHDVPFSTIFTDTIPRKIIVGCLDQNAVNGAIGKSPFNFVHANISEISIDASGRVYPSQPILTEFEAGHYAEAFVQFFENLGCVGENRSLPISYAQYAKGFTLFAFNLTPSDVNSNFELIRHGTTSIKIRFAKPTPSDGLQLLVYAEEDGLMMLDHFRNVFTDHQA